MRNEYDFSQSRKSPYASIEKGQSDTSAQQSGDALTDLPATSAFDWDGAYATRSSAELRAKVAALRVRSGKIK